MKTMEPFGDSYDRRGQSLIELLIAISITIIIAGSAVGALLLSVRINKESINFRTASSLAQEMMDKMRSFSEGQWVDLYSVDTKDASSTYFIFNQDTIVATDALSAAGEFSSLAVDSMDNPVIAYHSAGDVMKVLHCNDGSCMGDDESIEVVDSGGLFNSLELDGSGFPVIAHSNDAAQLYRIVHCNDANCDPDDPPAGGAESIESFIERVSGLSLELDDSGYPVVSYQRKIGKNLKLLHCNDPNCSGADDTPTVVDGRGQTGDYTSLAISPSTGIPVIAYSDSNKLGVVRCNDVDCADDDETFNQVDTDLSNVEFISLQLDENEFPVVSYFDAAPRYNLKILHCYDIGCFGSNESIEVVDTLGGESTSLQLDAFGNPVVSYIADGKLKILHCNDPNCNGGDESIIAVDDADPDANISGTSLKLDSLGNPVVSYYDDINDDLKVLHCDDPNCDSNVFTALAIASGTEEISVNSATYTRWFSVENVNRDSNGDITESGGTEDPSTQKVTVHVQWQELGDTASISLTEYYTRWYKNVSSVFTNWRGPSDVEGPITAPNSSYSTTTGSIAVGEEIQLSGSGNLYGGLTSSIFDARASDGVKVDSIFWHGSLNGAQNYVRFKIATSNCANGATDPPNCATSVGWSDKYMGPGVGWYNLAPDVYGQVPTNQDNNKRYLRYLVELHKDAALSSPVVEDIILNWTP